jgi:predicted DNA-binding transcriptional regulator AlpA
MKRSVVNDPLLVSLRDASKLLGLSEKTVWTLAKTNRIPSLKVNSRRLFSVVSLESWIASQLEATAASA